LDDLKRSTPARVITVSSQLHIPGYAGGPVPDFDYAHLKGEKYYNPQIFYKNSKLLDFGKKLVPSISKTKIDAVV